MVATDRVCVSASALPRVPRRTVTSCESEGDGVREAEAASDKEDLDTTIGGPHGHERGWSQTRKVYANLGTGTILGTGVGRGQPAGHRPWWHFPVEVGRSTSPTVSVAAASWP